ncbi:MAG TPA: hopanoid-associated sugar epimerase [Thermodesulfobacteriota bacterium]|jgi:dihydroflavonol-4-reductase|nr:hopanoid-associated sugar epimerase [Thermodesulfobacteriota bacterium]
MKTLISGAAGFIGSAVLRRLLAAGHDVRAVILPQSDHRNLVGLPVEIVYGDITDRRSIDRAMAGCSVVFHVAGDYRLWIPKPDEVYQNNVAGTRNVMLAAIEAGIERVVYTSSVATLGSNPDGSPADEETRASLRDMIGHYKRSKFMAEAEVKRLADEQGLPVVIVNPSAPLGPRDIKPTPTGRIIVDAVSGRMPAYVDTGLNVVHVDDVGAGHLLALERGKVGDRYILGGTNMTLKEILCVIASLTGQPLPRIRLPHSFAFSVACLSEVWASLVSKKEPRATLIGVRLARKKMFFSIEKARRVLGFNPRPAEEALRDAIGWFRENGYLC